MLTIADVAVGPTIVFGGLALGLVLLIAVVLLEALVMWFMKWGRFGPTLLDALLANIVSTVIGVIGTFLFYNAAYGCEVTESADGLQRVEECGFAVSPLLWLVIAAIISIIVEGIVLGWRRKYPPRITWDAAIAANVVSYALLAALAVFGILNFG